MFLTHNYDQLVTTVLLIFKRRNGSIHLHSNNDVTWKPESPNTVSLRYALYEANYIIKRTSLNW